jgi:hypothetical protein
MRPLFFLFVACLPIVGCPSATKPSSVESGVLCAPDASGDAASDSSVEVGVSSDASSSASASASACDLKPHP